MKTALVTGASRGIGEQVSLELASKGYHVFLAARNRVALETVSKKIHKRGGTSELVSIDLLDLKSIKAACKHIKSKTQQLDLLANIAGMYHDDTRHFFNIPFEDYPDEAIIKNINASLVGHVLLTKQLVPLMRPGSCIINISGTFDDSETGVISDFLAKKAIEIFSKQVSLELKDKAIRSVCIRLGFVFTESVRKFFPAVQADEALDPTYVAKRIVSLSENTTNNGKIIELTA